jgi:hypothetical protein
MLKHSKFSDGGFMKRLTQLFLQTIFVASLFTLPSFAADDEALKKDLTSVIALQGLPCMQVVTVKTQAENNYLVTCKDENKYHIYVNDKGRVIVEKSK